LARPPVAEFFGATTGREVYRRDHRSRLYGRCAMTATEIKQAITEILADIAPDEDLSGLKEDVPFRDQLELDSMDFLDIVMELRKRYRIQIPEEEYTELASMASTVRYLEPRMKDL
jgi:acyl carrier protein